MPPVHHVVLFSGGVGSWAASKRVQTEPGDQFTLLFTDTLIEDDTLYDFIEEAAKDTGGELVRIADGRTPWEVFNDEGFIANTRVDICSRILKRDLARTWIKEHCDPEDTIVYMGIDWSEIHRFERAAPRWLPYILKAPLCDPPYMSKDEMLIAARDAGLDPGRLYKLGFPHSNCGGGCVKQGHAAWKLLYDTIPERFTEWENNEQAFRESTGKDVAILRDRRGGDTKPFTLTQLRERLESDDQLDLFEAADWGGCGCMVDD